MNPNWLKQGLEDVKSEEKNGGFVFCNYLLHTFDEIFLTISKKK